MRSLSKKDWCSGGHAEHTPKTGLLRANKECWVCQAGLAFTSLCLRVSFSICRSHRAEGLLNGCAMLMSIQNGSYGLHLTVGCFQLETVVLCFSSCSFQDLTTSSQNPVRCASTPCC
jgi:hypothetical protein